MINKDEKFFDAINGIEKIVSCFNIFENSPYLFEIITPSFTILAKSSILDVWLCFEQCLLSLDEKKVCFDVELISLMIGSYRGDDIQCLGRIRFITQSLSPELSHHLRAFSAKLVDFNKKVLLVLVILVKL